MQELFVIFSVCAVMLVVLCAVGLLLVWAFNLMKRATKQAKPPQDFATTVRGVGGQERDEGLVVTRGSAQYIFQYISNPEGPSMIRAARSIVAAAATTMDAEPELPAVTLREETERDHFGKLLGLNRELQTGDARFDERVYIECDSSEAAARIMTIPKLRAAVIGLLALGYRDVSFRLHGHALVASWQVGARTFDHRVVEQTITELAQIADALPPFRSVPNARSLTQGARAVVVCWALAALAFAAYLGADSLWKPLGSGLNSLTLGIMVLLFSLLVGIMWMLVRGRSQALRYLVWGALSGLLLAPCLSRAALVTYNGAGDDAITTYPRRLDRKNANHSDDSSSYYLHFAAVPGMTGSPAKLRVSSRVYNQARMGDDYVLTVGAGRLGVPWLQELKLAPSQPRDLIDE